MAPEAWRRPHRESRACHDFEHEKKRRNNTHAHHVFLLSHLRTGFSLFPTLDTRFFVLDTRNSFCFLRQASGESERELRGSATSAGLELIVAAVCASELG